MQRQVSSNDVKKTINEYLETIPKDANIELAFYGGSFTGISIELQKDLLSSTQEYIKAGRIQSIRISTRPDYINREILELLKDYKVETIELGVQSMDDEVLKLSNRGHTTEDVVRASNMIKEYNFRLGHQMMIGLPGDTSEKDISTAKRLIELKPDVFRIYPVLVIKGTELETMYKTGSYEPISLENAVEISKEILKLFKISDITVIRIGLQVTENINCENDVVAGPFHSAFKELVEAELRMDMIRYMLRANNNYIDKVIYVFVNNKEISKTIGQKKSNIRKMQVEFKFNEVKVLSKQEIQKGQVILKIDDKSIILNEKIFIYETTNI
jgi:radical SAM enzyme (TIGR01210 family)